MNFSEIGMKQYAYVNNTGNSLFKHRDFTGKYNDGETKMLFVENENWLGLPILDLIT